MVMAPALAGRRRGGSLMPRSRPDGEEKARQLWLPWRPRLRLIIAYPRGMRYVRVGLRWFDSWISRSFTGRSRHLAVAVFFLPYLVVSFLGIVLVLEITILAFAVSVYLVAAEWLLLILAFPIVLLLRLTSALLWPLSARAGQRRWTARVAGWGASRRATTAAVDTLTAGGEPPAPPWSRVRSAPRIWM
jgi:hypothetical protein